MAEGQDLTGATFTAQDPEDASAAVTSWRLAGSDAGDFTIADTGNNSAQLTFRSTPDYDQPADSNRDNEYLVTIRAYNGSVYGSLDVTVTVTDRNESDPVVTGRDTLSFRENTTSTLHTYRVTDMDRGAEITWSVRGTDGGDFTISDTGELSFSRNPNYERPADAGSDNGYEITVVASDGSNEGTLDVTITITDVNEGPEISEPVYNLFRISTMKASTTICRLVLSFLSQFFQSRRHFSSQAKDRSTTHRFGSTTKVCSSLRFTTSTAAPNRLCTAAAKGFPV